MLNPFSIYVVLQRLAVFADEPATVQQYIASTHSSRQLVQGLRPDNSAVGARAEWNVLDAALLQATSWYRAANRVQSVKYLWLTTRVAHTSTVPVETH